MGPKKLGEAYVDLTFWESNRRMTEAVGNELVRLISKNPVRKAQDTAIFAFVGLDFHRCKGTKDIDQAK